MCLGALCRAVKRHDDATCRPEHVELAAAEVPDPPPLGDLERRQPREEHEDAPEPRRIGNANSEDQSEQHERLHHQRGAHEEPCRLEPGFLEKSEDGILRGELRKNVRNKEQSAENAELHYGISEIRNNDGVHTNLPVMPLKNGAACCGCLHCPRPPFLRPRAMQSDQSTFAAMASISTTQLGLASADTTTQVEVGR